MMRQERSRGWFRSMDDPEVESIPVLVKELQPSAEISRLGVAEKYQNRGIARELLAGAMEK